jgi:quinol monooxygenase YgiN
VKVFPIKLKDGMQDKAEAVAQEFAPKGPGAEDGTLSFRVYRDLAKPDYLLFVEHFADQAAYDAHTSSPAYRDRRPVREHDHRVHRTRSRTGRRPVEPAALRR